MSSHHVIRENQEPAVAIITVGNCNMSLLNSALEWSPHVVAVDTCAPFLIDRGIKIDTVLTDEKQRNDFPQPHVVVKQISLKQPLRSIINYLEENDHQAVHVFTTFELSQLSDLTSTKLDVSIMDGNMKWSLIRDGVLSKWFPKGSFLQTASFCEVKVINGQQQTVSLNELADLEADGILKFKSAEQFWLGERIA